MKNSLQIKEYLKDHKLLCDGAFGTYYASLCNDGSIPERANLEQPDIVKRIHCDYIKAGAGMIRTNTFAANREMLGCNATTLKQNLQAAVRLAGEARLQCGKETETEVFLAGDIGPIPQRTGLEIQALTKEYLWIASRLLDAGVDLLVFETFSDYEVICETARQIKKEKDVFIIMQFSVNQHGYTIAGLSARRIAEELAAEAAVDALGFNCGIGPGHLLRILEGIYLPADKFLTAFPNASYPKVMQERLVFLENREYFSKKVSQIADLGADIIGGCCGTNPSYIAQTAQLCNLEQKRCRKQPVKMCAPVQSRLRNSAFFTGKEAGKKLLAVELAPPFHADDEKIMDASNYLKGHLADAVTLPDSPSGRTRADSVMMGIKVAQRTGICVMPHICCRDKNAIAIRAQLLGAYMNGIRNLLVITGDPVPVWLRSDIRSVYNFDSVGLMKIIRDMNADEFAKDPIVYGGALSYNRRNMEVEIERIHKKMEAGAEFFLTQPVFTEEDAARLEQIQENAPAARILCGIMPLVSRKNALFIKNEMTGIQVTEEIIERYGENMTREQGEEVGIGIAREVIGITQDFAAGYYFSIPFNRVHMLDKITAGMDFF